MPRGKKASAQSAQRNFLVGLTRVYRSVYNVQREVAFFLAFSFALLDFAFFYVVLCGLLVPFFIIVLGHCDETFECGRIKTET